MGHRRRQRCASSVASHAGHGWPVLKSQQSWQAALTVFTQQPLVRLWVSCSSSSNQQAAMQWRLEGPRPKGAGAGGAGVV